MPQKNARNERTIAQRLKNIYHPKSHNQK